MFDDIATPTMPHTAESHTLIQINRNQNISSIMKVEVKENNAILKTTKDLDLVLWDDYFIERSNWWKVWFTDNNKGSNFPWKS